MIVHLIACLLDQLQGMLGMCLYRAVISCGSKCMILLGFLVEYSTHLYTLTNNYRGELLLYFYYKNHAHPAYHMYGLLLLLTTPLLQ